MQQPMQPTMPEMSLFGPQRTPRMAPAQGPPPMHGLPAMNLGLGLPSGFSRGGLGNGVQLPIQQHVPSMPMHLPSMSGQQFLQMPMPQASPLFTPRQDFRSLSGPPGPPFPAPQQMHPQQMQMPSRFDAIAREFNMDTNLIEALVHRLALEQQHA
jgi:hypothetical protein